MRDLNVPRLFEKGSVHPMKLLQFLHSLTAGGDPTAKASPLAYASHIGQDRWVAECFSFKKGGYFLDFGAFDGVTISNSLFLERMLDWKGICVEPNPTYYPRLCVERRVVTINAALWPTARQSLKLCDAHGLSSVEQYAGQDSNADLRQQITRAWVSVDSVNPAELMTRFAVPEYVEYLSLDTEGCECEILEVIDFAVYKIALITVEHNHHAASQARARRLLNRHGYCVVQNRNDDWFWHPDHLKAMTAAAGLPLVDPEQKFQEIYDTYPITC